MIECLINHIDTCLAVYGDDYCRAVEEGVVKDDSEWGLE